MRRRRLLAGVAVAVGALLLARWLMSPEDDSAVTSRTRTPSVDVTTTPPDSLEAQVPQPSQAADTRKADAGILQGRVIDAATREPVREFELQLHARYASENDGRGGPRHFRTPDGNFDWRDAPAGVWLLTATARGYQRFDMHDVSIQAGTANEAILLPLRRGHRLAGRVFDQISRAAIGGARISMRESHLAPYEGDWRVRPQVSAASDGTFVLDGVPSGSVTLTVSAPNYAPREVDVIVDDQSPPLAIALSGGASIEGYLAAADGATPVRGRVELLNLDDESGQTHATGEAGEFSFQNIAPGRYVLTGYAHAGRVEREFVFAGDEQVAGLVLAVLPGRSIRGVVMGLRPEDLQQVTVQLRRDQGVGHETVRVDTRGAFEFNGVRPGGMEVVADLRMRRQVARHVVMPADTDLTVNLEFQRGARLTGRVTRGGKPLPGVGVTALPRSNPEASSVIYRVITSANGEYSVEGLVDGDYTVSTASYRSDTFRIAGDTVFDIDIPSGQLSGRVVEGGGTVPIVGASVVVWSAPPEVSRVHGRQRSDHLGQFALAGLEPGDFVLSIYKPGYEMHRERISYGSSVTGMTIRLRSAKGVEVRAHEAGSGRPLRSMSAMEMIANRNGYVLDDVQLDENGVGYLPAALAGSTLRFMAAGYSPIEIRAWTGQGLELKFERSDER